MNKIVFSQRSRKLWPEERFKVACMPESAMRKSACSEDYKYKTTFASKAEADAKDFRIFLLLYYYSSRRTFAETEDFCIFVLQYYYSSQRILSFEEDRPLRRSFRKAS